MAYKINEDLYIGNTNKQLKDLLAHYGDTLPIGGIVNYDGSTVPEGYESVGNDYSTNEINTGKTWIDGKPIYRIVKQKYVGTDKAVISLSNINFDNIWLNGNSFIKTDAGIFKPLNVFESADYSIRTEINVNEKEVNIWGKSVYYRGTAYVILEYTKTTD